MPYEVEIRRNADGVTRRYRMSSDWPSDSDCPEFWWTEGNGGCDCNRALFFKAAGGEDNEDDDTPCGETLYTVTKAILPDGREIRIDGEPA